MLAVLCGFHGLSPCHGFSCPAALLPVGSYLRLVVGPKDKVGKVTLGSHAYKSLLLKSAWPVLCHRVLWDPPCCCLIAPCHMLSVRAAVAQVSTGFALPSVQKKFPEHVDVFRLTGMQRSKREEKENPQQNCV